MKSVVHQAAKAELRKSREWYENRQEGLGLELLDDARAALSKIERDPAIGIRYMNTPFMFYRTNRFPYVIYYLE